MSERYTTGEAMEHVEHAREALEKTEHYLLKHVPLAAAALAVFAGLSSLLGARTGEAMLATRTEAVLSQARATDDWNEYEADSLKAHLNETIGVLATTPSGKSELATAAKLYRSRQDPIRESALASERKRDDDIEQSARLERRKQQFDIAVALAEIAIVLTSVAAMTKQPGLFVTAACIALAGVVFDVLGFVI
jgi:Domain of unknown function (DUF4337)